MTTTSFNPNYFGTQSIANFEKIFKNYEKVLDECATSLEKAASLKMDLQVGSNHEANLPQNSAKTCAEITKQIANLSIVQRLGISGSEEESSGASLIRQVNDLVKGLLSFVQEIDDHLSIPNNVKKLEGNQACINGKEFSEKDLINQLRQKALFMLRKLDLYSQTLKTKAADIAHLRENYGQLGWLDKYKVTPAYEAPTGIENVVDEMLKGFNVTFTAHQDHSTALQERSLYLVDPGKFFSLETENATLKQDLARRDQLLADLKAKNTALEAEIREKKNDPQ